MISTTIWRASLRKIATKRAVAVGVVRYDSVVVTAAAAAATVAAAAAISYSFCEQQQQQEDQQQIHQNDISRTATTTTTATTGTTADAAEKDVMDATTAPPADPSWVRRALYRMGLVSGLPFPRRVCANGTRNTTANIDPALRASSRLLRQRARDEQQLPKLQQAMARAVQRGDHETAQGLVLTIYDTLYGDGMTPQRRTEFLMRYGCTAWDDNILRTLVTLAEGRGMVEIGAGHGQWARALQEYRDQQHQRETQRAKQTQGTSPPLPHPRTVVRAYDDGSQLPLNPNVYRKGTAPYEQYFGTVSPCPDIPSVLAQFENRHRILLVVYPSPDSDMAVDALQAYAALYDNQPDDDDNPHHHHHHPEPILIYVGEGLYGANANEAFFQALATTDHVTKTAHDSNDGTSTTISYAWYLIRVLDGVPCGNKGEEKVYIFQRRRVSDR